MKKTTKTPPIGPIEFIIGGKSPKEGTRVVFSDTEKDETITREDGSKTIQIGIGKKPFTKRSIILLPRRIISRAKTARLFDLVLSAEDVSALPTEDGIGLAPKMEIFAREAELANFEFVHYKTVPEEGWNFVRTITIEKGELGKKEIQDGIERGAIVAHEVNRARTLANIPGGEMTPKLLTQKAKEAVHGTSVKIKVLGRSEMKRLGMGGILGVAQGSIEEPQLIVLEYKAGPAKEQPVVLVGKGITFDTGGLNLKPGSSINEMHMDMSGGAAVISSIVAASKLGVKKNIVGLIPAAENMPSGSSYRPGDILRTMSGKTIEIGNTDAEGRVVLSDALTYAEQYKPRLVVDIATLTGAAMVALGTRASAIFSKDDAIIETLRKLGEESGDYVWPLPLWDEYEKDIKGMFADVTNSGKSRYGGSIEGAMFLYQFAKNYPWAHIDMAPRMTASDDEHLAKGAAGAPIRLLVHLLENY